MILRRAQIELDTDYQVVEETMDALAGSGLPWLSSHDQMDVEPGINDFDESELNWLNSLSRNAKSLLASTLTKRFMQAKPWEQSAYKRQLQIVIRILSVLHEFRRLNDVLLLALSNNSRHDILTTLIVSIASWHAPLEGMGVFPALIDALASNVLALFTNLIIVEKSLSGYKAKYIYRYNFIAFT
jgi:hypothetical protein